ncbi:MAG: threonine synthase, partial [Coriobacteriia bacterium]|nr:threonine synthase [Coriobacteriia bacterium]
GWMAELAEHRRFTVDKATFATMRETFLGDWVTNDESLATIARVYRETGYLMDAHTAVAWEVAERMRGEDPVLVVSTAHWAKFGADVYRALTGVAAGAPLEGEAARMTGLELLGEVCRLAPDAAPVPEPLAELASLPERFDEVVDAGREGIEAAVREWLGH